MSNSSIRNDKPVIFQLTHKRKNPALEGRFYPLQQRLPSIEEIYDPETETTRQIRYAVGETSIFKDEQARNVKLADIVFQNGKVIVDKTNPKLLQFMELSNHNQGNPNRIRGKEVIFKKLDSSASAKASVDTIVLESQAVSLCLTTDFAKLKGYARVLGRDINVSADEIRHDMILLAKKDPKKFIDGLDDPTTRRSQTLLDAREYGIIMISGRSVKWNIGDNKGIIINTPIGRDVMEYLSEWTMTERDGEEVYEEIKKRLEKLNTDK
jgi:hypothetical protein